jgi:type VI secretion system secreted protein Hcp
MAFDAFLKIDGVDGESTDATHDKWISVLSFSWGVNQVSTGASGSGASAGRAQVHDLSFTKVIDKASPKLMLSCATGQHIKKAVLSCRQAGREDFLKITFENILISSFVEGGHAGSEQEPTPSEQVSLNFQKVQLSYTAQSSDGVVGTPTVADATVNVDD